MFKTKNLIMLMFLIGCDVVSVDSTDPSIPNGQDQTNEVNLGEGSIPSDQDTFGLMLHNNDSKTWSAQEFTIEGFSNFLDCRLDDTITLFVDGTYEYDGGSNLCGGEDSERSRTGNWSFNSTDNILIFEPGSSEESSVTVVTLDNQILTFRGIYQSDIFGSYDIEGRYSAN